MAKDKDFLTSRDDLIEVYSAGEPIRIVHAVGPYPVREIVKDKRAKVFRRSGIIQRMLKDGAILQVKPSPPPPAKVVESKAKPPTAKRETKPEK